MRKAVWLPSGVAEKPVVIWLCGSRWGLLSWGQRGLNTGEDLGDVHCEAR